MTVRCKRKMQVLAVVLTELIGITLILLGQATH